MAVFKFAVNAFAHQQLGGNWKIMEDVSTLDAATLDKLHNGMTPRLPAFRCHVIERLLGYD